MLWLLKDFYMKKYVLIVVLMLCLFWHFIFKVPVIRHIYATPSETIYNGEVLDISIQHFTEPQDVQYARLGGYDIEYTFKSSFSGWARVVYVDVYEDDFYLGFKTEQALLDQFYDAVSPLDISLIIGETATDGNWQKISFTHEYRLLRSSYRYKDNPIYRHNEVGNVHVLPANISVRRGIDTINKGDIVFVKGWLLDWKGTEKFKDIEFKTALTHGEISKERYGGRISGKCYYLYLTELIVGEYIFK